MLSPETKKQIGNISSIVLIFGLVQAVVFAVLSRVTSVTLLQGLAGTVAGCLMAVFNLLLLGISVEKSLKKGEKNAQAYMSITYIGRLLITAALLIAVIKLPGIFNLWAAVIPLVFPRIAILIINLKSKNKGGDTQ